MDLGLNGRTALVMGASRGIGRAIAAALAGIPSVLAVIVGLHWLGAAVAVVLFAIWCARLPDQGAAWTG